MEYKYVGSYPRVLEGGRPVAPGEPVELSDDEVRQDDVELLISQGELIPLDSEAEHEGTLAERRVRGRQKKEGEE